MSEKMQSLLIDNNIVLNFDKETENSEIDLKTKEGDELILKQRDIFRRKSSSGSTTISKPEEISELFSCPDSPKNNNNFQEYNYNNIYFDKNIGNTNQVYNYYQTTLEYLYNTFNENQNYIKTKNYISKQKIPLNKESLIDNNNEYKKADNELQTKIENNEKNNTINLINNSNKTMLIPSFVIYYGLNNKFDTQIYYYFGFYQWNSKLIIFFENNFILLI